MPNSRSFKRLENRLDITEVKFSGNFSQRKIAHEIERIQARILNKRMQVLLPYETWKPGAWFTNGDDISIFILFDHYDKSCIPD